MTKRDWTIPLGPVRGKKGQTLTASGDAACFFKGQLLIAVTEMKMRVGRKDDVASKRVESAKITSLVVGDKLVFGLGVEPPVVEKSTQFDRFELPSNCPIYWPGTKIGVMIEFIEDGVWYGTLIGKAVSWEDLLPQVVEAFNKK